MKEPPPLTRRQKIVGWAVLFALLVFFIVVQIAQVSRDHFVAEIPIPKT